MRTRRLLPLALGSLLVLPFAARAQAGDPPPEPPASVRVLEHDLRVRLIPKEHRLIAEDRVLVDGGGSGGLLQVQTDRQLEWVGMPELAGREQVESAGHQGYAQVTVPAGRSTVVLRYRGVIYDAVEKAGGLTWVAGDGTKGLISEKGVYLAPSSRWIPTPKDAGLAKYHVTAYVQAPFHVVTQGSVPERTEVTSQGPAGAGEDVLPPPEPPAGYAGIRTPWNVLRARAVLPTDGLTLVAGPYETKSRVVDGVTIGTFLYAADAKDADLWLDATEAVVKRYAKLLGRYPHAKFDVVENFFQTGYGMPSYTLLGDQVIQYVSMDAKRKGGRIPPGYVDHEYVHGWYGNGLFVDYAKGNWCEALTTYCSNYLAKELESVGEARAHRRGVLEKWSMRVKGAKDTPVRAFQEKTEDTDNDIGYGKGSMIFHLIRRQVGDDVFWATLRTFTQKRVGTVVSWDDWFQAFDEASGISVTAHVKPYLDRKGLPAVTAIEPSVLELPGGKFAVTFGAVQRAPADDGGERFPLSLPVILEGVPDAEREHELDLGEADAAVLTVETSVRPRAVVLDPDCHALRRIEEADLPPCLERTLTAGAGGKGVIVLAGGGEKTLKPLADEIATAKGLKLVGPEFDLTTFSGPALVLQVVPEGKRSITVDGTTYDDPAISVLQSSAQAGVLRSSYTALSEDAAARASRLPFYGWDPWVVFRSGRPIARDPRNRERPSTRIVVDERPTDAARRVKDDLDVLCAPDFEGRWPGTEGHEEAGRWLNRGLIPLTGCFGEPQGGKLGDDPERRFQRFEVEVPALAKWGRIMTLSEGKSIAPVASAYRPFSFSAAGSFTVSSLEVVPWSETSIRALHADAEKRGKAVAYRLTPEAATALAPFLDYVDDLTPEAEAELAKPGRDGKPRARPPLTTWISGRRARLAEVLPRLPHPVIALTPEGEKVVETLAKGGVTASFEIAFAPPVTARIVGASVWSWDARAADRRRPTVLLMAHYDSFGKQEGKLWVGADDNGTGVACLREIVRLLNPKGVFTEEQPAADVLVVFTDAEEWGLLGSRELVKALAKTHDVRAVINVDSIGRAVSKPTHVLGLSKHPALARLVRNALEREGLVVGPDIDQYGYEHGSDHWPFHEAGIPAVTLWASDYGVMNTADDTPEKVEPEGVARIAAALARLLQNDLAGLVAAQDPPAKR